MAATPAAVRGDEGVRASTRWELWSSKYRVSRAGVGSHCATLSTRGGSLGALLKLDLAHLPLALALALMVLGSCVRWIEAAHRVGVECRGCH